MEGIIMGDTDVLPAPEIEPAKRELSKWERERTAFWRSLPSLLSRYRGRYVAIHDGEVVDDDAQEIELALRVYKRFKYVPIYVGRVSDEPSHPLRVPSPRLLQAVPDA